LSSAVCQVTNIKHKAPYVTCLHTQIKFTRQHRRTVAVSDLCDLMYAVY